MALIIWNAAYSVGVDSLDADHVIITSLINHIDEAKLSGADEAAVAMILRTLIQYSLLHFRREEALMRKSGYPDLTAHMEQHHIVQEQLQELYDEYTRTPDPEISKEIMELLNFWIVDHILKIDMKYKPFL
ncbi:MAG: bacteriohemerythrin [Rhodospirillales bacterium]